MPPRLRLQSRYEERVAELEDQLRPEQRMGGPVAGVPSAARQLEADNVQLQQEVTKLRASERALKAQLAHREAAGAAVADSARAPTVNDIYDQLLSAQESEISASHVEAARQDAFKLTKDMEVLCGAEGLGGGGGGAMPRCTGGGSGQLPRERCVMALIESIRCTCRAAQQRRWRSGRHWRWVRGIALGRCLAPPFKCEAQSGALCESPEVLPRMWRAKRCIGGEAVPDVRRHCAVLWGRRRCRPEA